MATRTFKEALKHRRSYYAINGNSPISDDDIKDILDFAITHVPSAFNSQSTRLVLLLKEHHHKFWNIVKEKLQKMLPEDRFIATKEKIEQSFDSGYGTILFFEDENVVKKLQENFPPYEAKFPVWSEQTSAMHQLAIWTMLEDSGLGASLQHYNPLIDEDVHRQWNIPENWQLIAQMPFGTPLKESEEKPKLPVSETVKTFK